MGKKEQDIAVAAREVLVGALGDALFAKRDWLGVAENLSEQVAREYQSRMDETSGLLKMLGDLGKRLERAERRLEHYRRKELSAHAGMIWESCRPISPIRLLNMAGWHRLHSDGCSDPGDPSDVKRCMRLLVCASDARKALHAEGRGVP